MRKSKKKAHKPLIGVIRNFRPLPKWVPRSPQLTDEDVATALFTVFHIECGKYDDGICTGGECADGSGKVPANARETELVKRNTERLAALLLERAERLGISKAALTVGDSRALGAPYDRLIQQYPTALSIIGGSFGR